MATCRSIVNSALRKIGVLAAGREARPTDFADALSSLQALYYSLIDGGAFGRLRDVIPIADYVANENERVFRQNTGCTQVTLPETVAIDQCWNVWNWETDPWGPINQNTANWQQRPPRDTSVVVINDAFTGITTTYIYDGSVKLWQAIDELGPDDNAPLSARNSDGLSSLLSMQIVDEFGGDMPQATVRSAAQFQSGLATRFSMPRTEAVGVYL